MLTLPLLPPQPTTHRPPFLPRSNSPPRSSTTTDNTHNTVPHHQRRQQDKPNSKTHGPSSTPLALLTADETALAHRKAAIRGFGAYWIRPPGVGKTLQAQREEEAEAAEQEELMRQEQGLRDLQARQEVEEARARAVEAAGVGAGVGVGEVEVEGGERDLDDDIPDADADSGEEEGESDVLENEADLTFNEDSLLQGSTRHDNVVDEGSAQYAVLEEAELTGAARDEEDLGIARAEPERDLDDSIPEAGSYQHTDTEVEDSSDLSSSENDGDGLQDSFAGQSARRATRQQQQQWAETPPVAGSAALQQPGVAGAAGLQQRIRAQTGSAADADALTRSPGSLNLSSSLLESSFVGSSPVMARGRGGARGRRGRSS